MMFGKLKKTQAWVVVVSIFIQVSALFLMQIEIPQSLQNESLFFQAFLLVICGTFLSIIFVFYRESLTITIMFLKIAILSFILLSIGGKCNTYQFLIVSYIIEVSFFFGRYTSIVFTIVISIITLFLSNPHLTLEGVIGVSGIPQTVATITYSISLFVFIQLLKNAKDQQEKNRIAMKRMESALVRFADTNLAFQNYTLLAEEKFVEKERQRISREVHDIVGYSLTNVLMLIQAAQNNQDPEKIKELLEKAGKHAASSIDEARLALRRLRDNDTYKFNNSGLFVQLVQSFSEISGINIAIDFTNLGNHLQRVSVKPIYRFLQEGMINSFRHGKANKINITFGYNEANKEIFVRMLDNGHSAFAGEIIEGIGIKGMRERLSELGGNLKAVSLSDGFLLQATIPAEYGDDNEE